MSQYKWHYAHGFMHVQKEIEERFSVCKGTANIECVVLNAAADINAKLPVHLMEMHKSR
jgi:hypothetical protein